MKNVLITGVNGFIGRNLAAHLRVDGQIRLLGFDVDNSTEDLVDLLVQADFVFHLAGVNRPETEAEFQTSNVDLTARVINILRKKAHSTPLVLSSSTQAAQDNAYGRSKKLAEEQVFAYSKQTGAPVYVYRLPGLFGKWSRPNYNSVVSTFCYNISRNLPIQINTPEHLLTLTYIDDVISEFRANIEGISHRDQADFCFVPQKFQITLQELADLIRSFRTGRDTAIVPDASDLLTKYLYATYLSYLEIDNFSYYPDMKTDARGWLFELIKSPHMGQIFVSQTKPGITRGGHYHHTKAEKFVVVQGQGVIRFRKIDNDTVVEYPVSGEKIEIVDIPPGYTHDITNVGAVDLITLFWASEVFDPNNPDTVSLKV
jgi:UDP-2-acetamido-2,6-beta-L-arabino-hexul-4-ose reductase